MADARFARAVSARRPRGGKNIVAVHCAVVASLLLIFAEGAAAQPQCGPNTAGNGCNTITCPIAGETCVPTKVLCPPGGGVCHVIECQCNPQGACHVFLTAAGGPSCTGTCPNGECQSVVMTGPNGTTVECRCPPTECGPQPNGQGCLPVTCPIPNEICVATSVQCTASAGCRVIDCECRPQGHCHAVPVPGANPPIACIGPCPPGMTCVESAFDTNNDGVDDLFKCNCEPEPEGCCIHAAGAAPTCVDLPRAQCVEQGGEPLGPGSVCQDPRPCCQAGDVTAFCYMTDPRCCDLNGGVPQTGNVACSQPQACCLGNECVMVDPLCCDELGGTAHPNQTCQDNPCAPPECEPAPNGQGCLPVTCPDPNEFCQPIAFSCLPNQPCRVVACDCRPTFECHAVPNPTGTFPPADCVGQCLDGTVCVQNAFDTNNDGIDDLFKCDCEPPNEGCCLPHELLPFHQCVEMPRQQCLELGGQPLGPNSACLPSIGCCIQTAVGSLCVNTDPRCCELSNGVPQTNAVACTEPRACCLGNECVEVDQLCCDELGGVAHPNQTCADDPCQPQECGPTPDGHGCNNAPCLPGTVEHCRPRCVRFNPATGQTRVEACDCVGPEECHVGLANSGAAEAGGSACVVPDNGTGTVTLPPAGCEYLSPDEVHLIIDGLPAGTTIELAPIHRDFICHKQPGANVCSFPPIPDCDQPGGSLGGERECSDSQLQFNMHGTGMLMGLNRMLTIPMSFETHTAPRMPGDMVQSFDTDMFRLQGQLPMGDPDFDLLRITGGTGFGLPSPGHTTLTQLPGGNWAVDSFFDITYRIDFVGKPGGPLSGHSGSTTATIRMATGASQPTCVGICPPGQTCHRDVTTHTDGTITVCCRCEEPPVCGPNTAHTECLPVSCPIPGEFCRPRTVVCPAVGGPCQVIDCDCTPTNECHVELGAASPVCVGGCPPGEDCNRIVTQLPTGGVSITCECVPVACEPNAMGDDCSNVVCDDPSELCIPTKVVCTAAGGCRVVECDCGSPDVCHVQLNANHQPECEGGCPPGQQCRQTVTTTPDGVVHKCGCETPPECGPAPDGQGCNDTICPVDNDRCQARCVRYNPQTGESQVIDCACIGPDECHVAVGGLNDAEAGGAACVVPGNGMGTVTLPPAGCEYLSPNEVHMIIDGLPPGTTIELAPIHKDFICHKQPGANVCSFPPFPDCDQPGGTLGGDQECAQSHLNFNMQGTGMLAMFNRPAMIPVSFETHTGPRMPGMPVQSFDTDMFRLFGQITGDPDFDLLRVVGGTDFGLPSPGHTTLTQLPGGMWAVDSFFDINYRIDFVGAPGGPLGGHSGSTTGTIRMRTGAPPTCEGVCPPGQTCVRDVTSNGDGTVNICCRCEEPTVCGPNTAHTECLPVSCPIPGEFCRPRTVVCPAVGGPCQVIDCDCTPTNECHVELGAADPMCVGGCPPGEECNRIVTQLPTGGVSITCECIPVACEPNAMGDDCSNVVCDDPSELCIPTKVVCTAAGGCRVVDCDCGSPDVCHVQLNANHQPECEGGCPPGQQCHQTQTTTPTGIVHECHCEQVPQCEATPTGDACVQGCPALSQECIPSSVICGPGTTPCRVVGCECRNPFTCHVDLDPPNSPFCTGGCPEGLVCHERVEQLPTGQSVHTCLCLPPDQGCCLPDGECANLPPPVCEQMNGHPLGPNTECGEPVPCCLVGDATAHCIDMDRRCCEMMGGHSQGPNLECTEPQACCLPQGQCFEIDKICCDDFGGTPQGAGTHCGQPGVCHRPIILHQNGQIGQTRPCSGYIDPRSESNNGVALNQGLDRVTLLFSEPVFAPAGGPVMPADFIVTQTGAGVPPVVTAVNAAGNPLIEVQFNRIITLKQWTTIQAVVKNAGGVLILNVGNLGPVNETDRLDVGFLPADVNQSGTVSPLDLLRFKQYVNGLAVPGCGLLLDYVDINRSGGLSPLDLLRFKQAINGINPPSTQAWAGQAMLNPRP